jgi:hypothetical protein
LRFFEEVFAQGLSKCIGFLDLTAVKIPWMKYAGIRTVVNPIENHT